MNIAQKNSKLFLHQDMHQGQQNKTIKNTKKSSFFFPVQLPFKDILKKRKVNH